MTPADKPALPALPMVLRDQPQHIQDAIQAYALNFAALWNVYARADERRKALLDAAWAARRMSSGRAAETAIHRMIDKEPTT